MIVGTTIIHPGSTNPYYSPSFPRGGEAATWAIDITQFVGGSATLEIEVEHKNLDDTSWGLLDSIASATAIGIETKDSSSIKEEIRFKFYYSAGSAGDFAHVVVSQPAWRPY